MSDEWKTFACQMGDHQAWITFNLSFADIAETDPRNTRFSIRLLMKSPTYPGRTLK
jgi:hypothetical protein